MGGAREELFEFGIGRDGDKKTKDMFQLELEDPSS